MRNLLMMSSSRAANPDYLAHGRQWLANHFAGRDVVFIPYAGVTLDADEYTARVAGALASAGVKVFGIHEFSSPQAAIEQAQAIAVGGGNTFMLLHKLYEFGLLDPLRQRILAGLPYAGWSAGSNILGTSIRTTNDMPIVQPRSFNALNVVPFQLNPHFTDAIPPGHMGETRSQRIEEFMCVDSHTPVLAIPEGTALRVTGKHMALLGDQDGVIFHGGKRLPLKAGKDCSQWL
ncbi:MAG: dipeptidase PepE [Idiomarina sp.]|nr:dipeptidase PepE [Idiomarina sp.]